MSTYLPKLEQSRKELLDLSGRNRFTNFQRPTAKRGGISISDELPEQIYRLLVEDGKSLTLLATTENTTGRPTHLLPLFDGHTDSNASTDRSPERYTDTKLQTLLDLEALDRRLRRMYTAARTFVEEQGMNVLYLAIGMLQWFESDSSQEKREAPLILIPVELYRDNVRTRYKLRYTGDEIGNNISLYERLWREFNLQLPSDINADNFNILSYFDAITQSISNRPRWTVDRSAIILDFFSFSKLQMYKDLDVESWSEVDAGKDHPVLTKLLGPFTFLSETLGHGSADSASTAQPFPKFDTKHLVVDADSSQSKAIQSAMNGKNLVIQGPPGTGKSQTITNIIAEAIGHGKSVLFVAEKMAALEVVKRRLDKLGLGDACLELHSHKANKKVFLAELERTLHLPEPKLANEEHQLRMLREERDYLDEYCQVVNTEIGNTEVTPYRAYGLYLQAIKQLEDTCPPKLALSEARIWNEADFQVLLESVSRFQSLLRLIGQPNQHPFWGSKRTVYLPGDQQSLRDAAIRAESTISQLRADADSASLLSGMQSTENFAQVEHLLCLLELILNAPRISGINLAAQEWLKEPNVILAALDKGELYHNHRKRYEEYLIPEAWKENLLPVRKAIVIHSGRLSRIWSRDYRQSNKLLKSISQRTLPTTSKELLALIDSVLEVKRLQPEFEHSRQLLKRVFGQRWLDQDASWSGLREIVVWIQKVQSKNLGEKHTQLLLDNVNSAPNLDTFRQLEFRLRRNLSEYRNALNRVLEIIQLDEEIRFGREKHLINLSFFEQTQLLHEWAIKSDQLQGMANFNVLRNSLCEQKLGSVVDISTEWEYSSSRLVALVKRTRYEGLIERAMREQPILASFNSATHQHRINRFRELDRNMLLHNRCAVLHSHWRNLPKHHSNSLSLLREQFNRKRGHKSIRVLMGEAGEAIQTIKPIFMMSPFSIATFLPPGSVHFDIVVFDEASQVKPVDAFGAILRGKQTVVVGDDKQLPPTNFFDSTIDNQDEDDNFAVNAESILGLFRAKAAHHEMLQWHYRSRHESLIAVSNYEFYGNRLIIFPSPDKERKQLGLVYHHLPYTTYLPRSDGTSGGRNDGEAQAVAKAVMEHACNHPQQTLLVATFNQQQRELIEEHVERLRKIDTTSEQFFYSNPEEPFVVKNLENVQGDERDVIFISLGYGKDKDNKVSMNFGPLNKDGGERRLNVLITRARDRCEIFTNLTYDDIDLSRTQSEGVRALKRFLKYAQTGILDVPEVTGNATESPFEQSVLEALSDAGYQVATQVGTGGYRIDLAIIDDIYPGRYLLGIECDGATYHRAQSARDRDRLRQEVLEGMGWHIHRIWSTDWFRNPKRELQRVEESIELARAKSSVNEHPNAQSVSTGTIPKESNKVESPVMPSPVSNVSVSQDEAYDLDLKPTPNMLRLEVQANESPVAQNITHTTSIAKVVDQLSASSLKVTLPEQKMQVFRLPSIPSYEVAQSRLYISSNNIQQIDTRQICTEICRIVDIEAPIHFDVLLRRISMNNAEEVLGRVEMAIDEAIAKKLMLRSKSNFFFSTKPKKILVRDRSNLNDIANKLEYVHYNELVQAISILVKHTQGIGNDDLAKETLRFLGYSQITDSMTNRVKNTIASMLKQGDLIVVDNIVRNATKTDH